LVSREVNVIEGFSESPAQPPEIGERLVRAAASILWLGHSSLPRRKLAFVGKLRHPLSFRGHLTFALTAAQHIELARPANGYHCIYLEQRRNAQALLGKLRIEPSHCVRY